MRHTPFFAMISVTILVLGSYVDTAHAEAQCLQRDKNGVATQVIWSGQAFKDFSKAAISCDKCSDEKVTISDYGPTIRITSQITHQCTQLEKGSGQCGKITYTDQETNKPYSISKCNQKLLPAIERSVDEQDKTGKYLKELVGQAPPPTNSGTQQLTQVLQGRFDTTSPEDRQKATEVLVSSGVPAVDAQEAIKRIASGDAEGGQAIVKRDLNLNPDTRNQVVDLNAVLPPSAVNADIPDRQPLAPYDTGFRAPSGWSAKDSYRSPTLGDPFGGLFTQLFSLFGQMNNPGTSANQQNSSSNASPLAQQETSSIAQQLLDRLQGKTISPDLNVSLRPVATVYAQPSTVKRGNPILVSWSSVGMKADSCVLRTNGTTLVQKNEGTKLVQTGPGTSQGVMLFSLSCTATNDQPIEREAGVRIE